MDICTANDVYIYLGSDAPVNHCIVPDVRAIEIISADIDHPAVVSYSGSVILSWADNGINTYAFKPQLNSLITTFDEITANTPVKITNNGTNCWTVVVNTTVQDLSNFFSRVLHIPSTIIGILPGTYNGFTTTYNVENPLNGYWMPPPSRSIGVVLQVDGKTISAFEGGAFQGCIYVDTPNTIKNEKIIRVPLNNTTVRGLSAHLQYVDKYPCSSDWSLIVRCVR